MFSELRVRKCDVRKTSWKSYFFLQSLIMLGCFHAQQCKNDEFCDALQSFSVNVGLLCPLSSFKGHAEEVSNFFSRFPGPSLPRHLSTHGHFLQCVKCYQVFCQLSPRIQLRPGTPHRFGFFPLPTRSLIVCDSIFTYNLSEFFITEHLQLKLNTSSPATACYDPRGRTALTWSVLKNESISH